MSKATDKRTTKDKAITSNDGLDLRTKVARAMWENGDVVPCPWAKLWDSERAEWLGIADAVVKLIRDEVVIPEYERWREAEEIAAMGACANIVAKLTGLKTVSSEQV